MVITNELGAGHVKFCMETYNMTTNAGMSEVRGQKGQLSSLNSCWWGNKGFVL